LIKFGKRINKIKQLTGINIKFKKVITYLYIYFNINIGKDLYIYTDEYVFVVELNKWDHIWQYLFRNVSNCLTHLNNLYLCKI